MTQKIRIASDLHFECIYNEYHTKHLNYAIPESASDKDTILILAGDIVRYSNEATYNFLIPELSERFKNVLMISGNHENYRGILNVSISKFTNFLEHYPNVIQLDRKSVVIGDVAFMGAVLWTNFNDNDTFTKTVSSKFMNDYSLIKTNISTYLTPDDLYNEHVLDVEFLREESKKYADYKKVVITHHGPSLKSIHEQYQNSGLSNYSFSSDLDYLVKEVDATIWVHGHTHSSMYYDIDSTTVICNPLGYPRSGGGYENIEYNMKLVLEI